MKKYLLQFGIIFLASSLAFAEPKGLKFSPEKNERYSNTKDPIVGPTTFDSAQNIVWMSCAVGQELNSESKVCIGSPDRLTFQQATSFAKKIGHGWRLPTYWEVKGASQSVMKILSNEKRESAGKYGGGGWDCERMGVWTTTGVEGNPNSINVAQCIGFSNGNNIDNRQFDKFGYEAFSLILVK